MAAIGGQMQINAHQRRLTAAPVRCQPQPFLSRPVVQRRSCVVTRAQADEDADLEQRLAALRKAKGATPDKAGAKAAKSRDYAALAKSRAAPAGSSDNASEGKKTYDYSDETVHWEGGAAPGDLAFNIALGFTIVGIPLTIGSIARTAFVKYKFTDRRVSVVTRAPWESNQTDCAYQEVKEVRTVSRGLGAWGDMVIELKNGDKLELRSLEKFKELKEYVLARRDALGGGVRKNPSMMDLDMDDDEALKKKGFA